MAVTFVTAIFISSDEVVCEVVGTVNPAPLQPFAKKLERTEAAAQQ
jgi:hypothetical protein